MVYTTAPLYLAGGSLVFFCRVHLSYADANPLLSVTGITPLRLHVGVRSTHANSDGMGTENGNSR